VRQALSCYYSGNFTRGFQADKPGGTSYVQRVVANANVVAQAPGAAADRPTLNPAVIERAVAREPQPAAPVPPSMPAAPPVASAFAPNTPVAAAVPAATEKKPDAGPVPLRVVPAISVRASTPAPKASSSSAGSPERLAGEADQPRSAAIVF